MGEPAAREASRSRSPGRPAQNRRQRQRAKKQAARGQKPEDVLDREEATRGYMTKTQWCKFFKEGACDRGANCTFAHYEHELKVAPDFTKTRMCQAFLAGECRDENCGFAHSKDEIRKIDPAVAAEVAALRKQRLADRQQNRPNRKRRRGGSDDGSDDSDETPSYPPQLDEFGNSRPSFLEIDDDPYGYMGKRWGSRAAPADPHAAAWAAYNAGLHGPPPPRH